MKKKIILSIVIGVILLAVIIPGILIYKFFQDAKDYKKVLGVNRPVESSDLKVPAKDGDEGIDAKQEFQRSNVINLLFLGIDKTDERDQWLGVYRPDTIALVSINMGTKKVVSISIPRDTYTYIDCIKKSDKINHSYVWGGSGKKGVESVIDTVNRFVKYTTVDYYFAIDMEPVPKIVDSIGGVPLDVELDMKTHGANLSKGYQVLDGQKAFDYIHWRFAGNGDIDRIKRQQKFMKAMLSKLKDTRQLLTTIKLVMNYNKYIKTNMSLKQLLALANLANDIPPGSIDYQTIPGTDKIMDGIWYWVPDVVKTDTILKEKIEEIKDTPIQIAASK